jgi:hypothetical protein
MSDNGGDRREERQMEEVEYAVMEAMRQRLRETTLNIGKEEDDEDAIFANPRAFVRLSQGNSTVQEVVLYLYGDYVEHYKTLLCVGKHFRQS